MIEHPFLNKTTLESKSLEELQEIITSLNKKLTFSYRTQNGPLIHQLQMVIEGHKSQQRKKMDEIFDKQKLSTKINIQSGHEQHKN